MLCGFELSRRTKKVPERFDQVHDGAKRSTQRIQVGFIFSSKKLKKADTFNNINNKILKKS